MVNDELYDFDIHMSYVNDMDIYDDNKCVQVARK